MPEGIGEYTRCAHRHAVEQDAVVRFHLELRAKPGSNAAAGVVLHRNDDFQTGRAQLAETAPGRPCGVAAHDAMRAGAGSRAGHRAAAIDLRYLTEVNKPHAEMR